MIFTSGDLIDTTVVLLVPGLLCAQHWLKAPCKALPFFPQSQCPFFFVSCDCSILNTFPSSFISLSSNFLIYSIHFQRLLNICNSAIKLSNCLSLVPRKLKRNAERERNVVLYPQIKGEHRERERNFFSRNNAAMYTQQAG